MGRRKGQLGLLLATSSSLALLVAGQTKPAIAACSNTISGTSSGYTNPTGTTIPCVAFVGATVNGNVRNAGTITPGTPTGISINNTSTINGAIINSGQLTSAGSIAIQDEGLVTGGINNSKTIIGLVGIDLNGAAGLATTFLGGITNSGTIRGTAQEAVVISVRTFSGGITNSGTIAGGSHGIAYIYATTPNLPTPTFSGGITNSGVVSAASGDGIHVAGGRVDGGTTVNNTVTFTVHIAQGTFLDGIANSGLVSAAQNGIYVSSFSSFGGGIVNAAGGSILAGGDGIRIDAIDTINNIEVTSFSGGITNSGTISAAGSGIHVLGGLNTVGGTVSNSGVISASGTVGNGDGINIAGAVSNAIINSGTVTGKQIGILVSSNLGGSINNSGFVRGDTGISVESITFASGITNSGTVAGTADGIKIASSETFAGGVTNSGSIGGALGVNVSTVSFGGGITNASNGTISGTVGAIRIAASSYSGGVTNAGLISGAAYGISVTAAGHGSFSGPIVNSGTISASIAVALSTAPNAITIDQNAGNITGAIEFSSHGDTLNVSGGSINGNIVGQNAGDTINFNYGSGTFTYASPFKMTGITALNVNSGTIILDGTGNSATTTTIRGGNLEVGDVTHAAASLTGTTVDVNGGTLSGYGTINGAVTIASGAMLAPGGGPSGAPGTLTVGGSVAFSANSLYAVEVNDATASNTSVSGTATINGGTVVVTPLYTTLGPHGGATYMIVSTAPLGRSGTFAGIVENGNFNGSLSLSYDNRDVFLDVGQGFLLLGASGANQNQQNVINGINSYILGGGTPPANFQILAGLSGPTLLNALTELDGENATGAEKGVFQLMTQFLDLMTDPTAGGGGNGGGGTAPGFASEEVASLPPDVALAYAGLLKAAPKPDFEQRWSAWGSGFGGAGSYAGNTTVGSNNVTAADYGYAAGMDYHVTPDTVYGFALGGGGTNWNLAQSLGSGRSDSFEAGVYAKTHWDAAYVSGALGFANHWFTTNRIALADDLTAKFQGQSYAARGEVGYRYAVPMTGFVVGVTPYAALQAQSFHTPNYSETDLNGGGFALSYASMNATDTRSELGARFDDLTTLNGMPLILRGRVAWAHDWVSNPALGAVFQALPGSNFTVNGAAVPQNSALTTAAAELHLNANWTATAKFDGEFASSAQTYAGTGTLKYSW
ncbi:MAG TPA: autotransporter domain-containing protein [Xanthobacteraceae bacterium]